MPPHKGSLIFRLNAIRIIAFQVIRVIPCYITCVLYQKNNSEYLPKINDLCDTINTNNVEL